MLQRRHLGLRPDLRLDLPRRHVSLAALFLRGLDLGSTRSPSEAIHLSLVTLHLQIHVAMLTVTAGPFVCLG